MIYPLLSIQNISTKLQGHKILDDITLTINKGEHWAVIGKSGSGKSSLLRAIVGKQGLSAGTISYNLEKFVTTKFSQSPLSQKIALIESRHHFKNFANTTDFYYQQRYNSSDAEDALTVEQYLISVSGKVAGNHCWDLEKVVDRLRLKDLYDKQIIKLSNGETKRLIIAAALIKDPGLLLVDQPSTGLDVNSRQYFGKLLEEIAASGITIIMATSPGEIPPVIQNIAVLENGKLISVLKAKNTTDKDFASSKVHKQIDADEIENLLRSSQPKSFDSIITMNNVNVKYGNVTVLKEVNWQIKQGERWALLGPNGAGKSTLLSLAYGDNPQAYSNDIILFDKKRGTGESIWDIKRKCGFVSPELFQYFPMDNNCLQVIESGFYDTLGLFRMSDPQRAALALRWMKVLDINKYARHLLKNIPASVQRLCLLARALVKNPALLILDEPCQGMDEQQLQRFKQIVDVICNKSNVTLIYVTHYQHEIPDTVDRYLYLEKGEVASVVVLSN